MLSLIRSYFLVSGMTRKPKAERLSSGKGSRADNVDRKDKLEYGKILLKNT